MKGNKCLFCQAPLHLTFVDLGMHPLCESYVSVDRLDHMEPFYPLRAYVCHECFLVQLDEYVAPGEIFSEYAYFSSYSDSWVEHARRYAEAMRTRLGLGAQSRVVELASNDGYLLQYFVERDIPCLGIEPAKNVAQVAIDRGVPTDVSFFGREKAAEMAANGQTLAAQNLLKKAAHLMPDNPQVFLYHGAVLESLEKYEEALDAFTQAAKINPSQMQAHYSRGLLLDKLGKTQEGIEALHQAGVQGPYGIDHPVEDLDTDGIEPDAAAQRRYVDRVQDKMQRTVWSTGGCASWYLDSHGRNVTLWPRTTFTFRRLTRRFDVEQYVVRPDRPARSTTTTKVGQTA